MSLKAVFSSVSEIPEQYRDLYSETSPGCWKLTGVEGIRTDQEWNDLQRSVSSELEAAGKITGICRKLGIEPDEIEKLSNGYSELKTKWEKRDSEYKRNLIDSALKDAALKAGIRAEAVPDVLARASLFHVSDDGKIAVSEEQGSLSPDEWLAKQLPESPHWLAPSRSGGIRQNSFSRGAAVKKLSMAEFISDAWNKTTKGK